METASSWDSSPLSPAIDIPFRRLAERVSVRPGEFVIVAAGEADGKSTLATNLAVHMPSLYVAQDNPDHVSIRLAALMLDITTKECEELATSDPRTLSMLLEEVGNHRLLVQKGEVSPEGFRSKVEAYTEFVGHPPNVVVVDNLIDMVVAGHTYHENTFYAKIFPALKQIASDCKTVVIGLHHLKRGLEWPPTSQGMLYGGERAAAHVWAVRVDAGQFMDVAILKQRQGEADRNGQLQVTLDWYPEYGRIE